MSAEDGCQKMAPALKREFVTCTLYSQQEVKAVLAYQMPASA